MPDPLLPSRRVMLLPFIVAATFFMEYLDTTVIATALPQMARSFGVGPNDLSFGMTAYMLALAVFIPVSGWVADRYGSRSVFCSAIAVFMLSSILCGLSTGRVSFTAARVLQGIGGAMMVPVGRLIVVRGTPKAQLIKAISTITWPAIAAPVIGPPIGGFITTFASWRWIFFLNVPIAIAALIAAYLLIHNERASEPRPLDIAGFVFSGAALTCLFFGAEIASRPQTSVVLALAIILAGVALAYGAMWHARNHPHPLIDFTTLKVPTFSVTVLSGSVTRIGIGAVPYLLPLLFQVGFGLSAFASGMLLLTSAIGNLGMKALTTRILRRYGFRAVSIVDVVVGGIFIIACGFLRPSTPIAITIFVIFIYGVVRSMQFSTLATLAYADIAQRQMSAASTLWSAAMQMTIGVGIAFGAVSLRFAAYLRGEVQTASSTHLTLGDFQWAFLFAGALTLLSLPGYLAMARNAGAQLQQPGGR